MKGKNPGMLLKIDLEKAFDKIELSFMKISLEYFWLSQKHHKAYNAMHNHQQCSNLLERGQN